MKSSTRAVAQLAEVIKNQKENCVEKEIDYELAGSLMRLNQLNVGDVIDERLEKDLRKLTGPKIEMRGIKIHFDKLGYAHTLDKDVIASIKIGDEEILK